MGKKFMVVKPKYCCGATEHIGEVQISSGISRMARLHCSCGVVALVEGAVMFTVNGIKCGIHPDRIVWLPDEDEFKDETYDEELTV